MLHSVYKFLTLNWPLTAKALPPEETILAPTNNVNKHRTLSASISESLSYLTTTQTLKNPSAIEPPSP